jgi:hypothetical protein
VVDGVVEWNVILPVVGGTAVALCFVSAGVVVVDVDVLVVVNVDVG